MALSKALKQDDKVLEATHVLIDTLEQLGEPALRPMGDATLDGESSDVTEQLLLAINSLS